MGVRMRTASALVIVVLALTASVMASDLACAVRADSLGEPSISFLGRARNTVPGSSRSLLWLGDQRDAVGLDHSAGIVSRPIIHDDHLILGGRPPLRQQTLKASPDCRARVSSRHHY